MSLHRFAPRWRTFVQGSLAGLLLAVAGCASAPQATELQLGGQRVRLVQRGQAAPGAPTVVFQSGLGDGADPWNALAERVAPQLASVAYDRPGLGGSGPLPAGPRDPCQIARELHDLLQRAGVAPPYLLVGHSLGGQYQWAFARLYPDEVAGLLLLDPTHPDHWTRMQQQASALATTVRLLRATAFGPAMRAEFDAQGSCLEAFRAPPPGSRRPPPTRLLVRSQFSVAEAGAFRRMVEDLEQDWLRLLPGATRLRVEGAGHYIHRDRPDAVAAELQALYAHALALRRGCAEAARC